MHDYEKQERSSSPKRSRMFTATCSIVQEMYARGYEFMPDGYLPGE